MVVPPIVQPKYSLRTTDQLDTSTLSPVSGEGGDTGFSVTLEGEHNFWSTVPASGDVFGHVTGVLLAIVTIPPCESEIADFEFAVCVHQEITGFKIPMKDICRVDVFQSAEDLVDERLVMCVRERLSGTDYGVKVRFQEFDVQIHGVEIVSVYDVHVVETDDLD